MKLEGALDVAAVQMDIAWMNVQKNISRVEELLAAAAGDGAKLVVFPELASSGYVVSRDREFIRQYRRCALADDSDEILRVAAVARQYDCFCVLGVLREHPVISGALCNSLVIFGPEGVVGIYDKSHIPSEEKHYFHQGSVIGVFPTKIGTLGTLICADNSFPETSRVLAVAGADILCASFNRPRFPEPTLHQALARVRAYDNQLPLISSNRVGSETWAGVTSTFEGYSTIVDHDGNLLAVAPGADECIIHARIDFDGMAESRLYQPRFRDRRPDLYGGLTAPHIPVHARGTDAYGL